jgi:hypothetical protein
MFKTEGTLVNLTNNDIQLSPEEKWDKVKAATKRVIRNCSCTCLYYLE